ncbi:hypothetical protein WMY93_006719 [Mugilogobius chulae]|uniref:Uncharacterized protein n=1 Tax=Mugilogobius chulae TaxID=88201 RepID=A0AAW0PW65_9GOBI
MKRSAHQKFSSIYDLLRLEFGRSVPRHSLLLLHWFAKSIRENYTLTFDPNGGFGSHHYGNFGGLLEPPPQDHRYFTVGNLHNDEFPEYVRNPTIRGFYATNRDRIVFSAQRLRTGEYRIHRVFLTQHQNDQSDQSDYDPTHTYEISTDLLPLIGNRSLKAFIHFLIKVRLFSFNMFSRAVQTCSIGRFIHYKRGVAKALKLKEEAGFGSKTRGASVEQQCLKQFHTPRGPWDNTDSKLPWGSSAEAPQPPTTTKCH